MLQDSANVPHRRSDGSGIADRIARFSVTRDPGDLWPGVTPPLLAAARREIERVTRLVLAVPDDGMSGAALHAPEHDARAASIAAYSIGMGALLGRWLEDSRIHTSDPLRMLLAEQLAQARAYTARVEHEVMPVLDALLAEGIVPIVIKGFFTARAYWHEPALRPAADVDFVVDSSRVDDVERILEQHGFTATSPRTQRPYKRHWQAAGEAGFFSVERPDARNAWRIDLHDSLDRGFDFAANARLDPLRHCVAPAHLAGRALLAPTQPLTLLQLCAHASRDMNSMRLLRLVEIVRVIRTDLHQRAGWDDVLAAMRHTGTGRYAYGPLILAESLAPGTVDPRVLDACRRAANVAIRRTVARLVPSGSSAHRDSLVPSFMWSTGPVDLVRRVSYRVFAGSPLGWLPRWKRLLSRMSRGILRWSSPDERETSRAREVRVTPRPPAAPEAGAPPAGFD